MLYLDFSVTIESNLYLLGTFRTVSLKGHIDVVSYHKDHDVWAILGPGFVYCYWMPEMAMKFDEVMHAMYRNTF